MRLRFLHPLLAEKTRLRARRALIPAPVHRPVARPRSSTQWPPSSPPPSARASPPPRCVERPRRSRLAPSARFPARPRTRVFATSPASASPPRETLTTPSPSPPATPRSQRVAARRTFLGKGVAGLAPVRYARAPTESSLDPGAARARPGTPSRRGVTMTRRDAREKNNHPIRPFRPPSFPRRPCRFLVRRPLTPPSRPITLPLTLPRMTAPPRLRPSCAPRLRRRR